MRICWSDLTSWALAAAPVDRSAATRARTWTRCISGLLRGQLVVRHLQLWRAFVRRKLRQAGLDDLLSRLPCLDALLHVVEHGREVIAQRQQIAFRSGHRRAH